MVPKDLLMQKVLLLLLRSSSRKLSGIAIPIAPGSSKGKQLMEIHPVLSTNRGYAHAVHP